MVTNRAKSSYQCPGSSSSIQSTQIPQGPSEKLIGMMLDNLTTVTYLNNQEGTVSLVVSKIIESIWDFALEKSIRIHAVHIPGKNNILADW
ncbi:3814_t:CDS:1, partial [Dentiscutata heterogama]